MADKEGRYGRNVLSFVLTFAVLCLAFNVSNGNFHTRINKISTDLNRALSKVFDEGLQIDYQDINVTATYNSDTSFNPRGMAGLYNITEKFMDAVITDLYPKDFVIINEDGSTNIDENVDWTEVSKHYAGLVALLSFLVVFAILMPICGFCFCCCRCCCNNCGSRSQPFDKKNDLCKKIIYASLLICLGTMLLFGVVCAFVSNQHMQEGTDELAGNLRTSVDDTTTYFEKTLKQAEILMVTNYNQFSVAIKETIKESAAIVSKHLVEFSNATSMTQMSNIANSIEGIQKNFTKIKISTNKMRVSASQLSDAMRKLKRDLLQTLGTCSRHEECNTLKAEYVNKMGTDIDFNSIPDVTAQIDSLNNFGSLKEKVEKGKQQLDSIETKISEKIDGSLADVEKTIDDAGKEINTNMESMREVLTDLTTYIKNPKNVDNLEHYLKEYSKYRYYIGLVVSCILLIISICIALGLMCGVCGKRPESYGDDCCNKGAGSRFLIMGVGIIFLTSLVLAVVAIVYIIVGIPVRRAVCDTLRQPEDSETMRIIDAYMSTLKNDVGIDVTIEGVLDKCRQNQSIYHVFNLSTKFDLSKVPDYVKDYHIEDKVNELKNEITSMDFDIVLMEPDMKLELQQFSETGIDDTPFDKIADELNVTFSIVNLQEFSIQLQKLYDLLDEKNFDGQLTEVMGSLATSKLHVETYDKKIVGPMKQIANEIIEMVIYMKDDLKFGKGSFKEAIIDLIEEIEYAQESIQNAGSENGPLHAAATTFADEVLKKVEFFLDRIVDKFSNEVGICAPLSLVLNATLTSTCDKILLPLNGHWFGILWSIFLFIPIIIVSVKLASLYQKYDPYPGSMIEAEYLYDAYADRENIPLASGKSGKKKHKKKRYEGRGYMPDNMEAGAHSGREYPGASHHQDTRYADMAPKHWEDFPNGGPPQYQRAPTEYERPPPYYYPGSGDQN